VTDRPAWHAPLAAQRAPDLLTREAKVRAIGEVAAALLDGRLASRECALYVGGALASWLEQGGDLSRDFLKITKPKSHNTPAAIWRELQAQAHADERQPEGSADTLAPSPDESDK